MRGLYLYFMGIMNKQTELFGGTAAPPCTDSGIIMVEESYKSTILYHHLIGHNGTIIVMVGPIVGS